MEHLIIWSHGITFNSWSSCFLHIFRLGLRSPKLSKNFTSPNFTKKKVYVGVYVCTINSQLSTLIQLRPFQKPRPLQIKYLGNKEWPFLTYLKFPCWHTEFTAVLQVPRSAWNQCGREQGKFQQVELYALEVTQVYRGMADEPSWGHQLLDPYTILFIHIKKLILWYFCALFPPTMQVMQIFW